MRSFSALLRDPGLQAGRRSHAAFLAQLTSPRRVIAARARGVFIALYASVLLAQMGTSTTPDTGIAWLGVVLAGVGTYLSWRLAKVALDLSSASRTGWEGVTRDQLLAAWPIPRALVRYVRPDFRRSGTAALNLSGVLEFLGVGLVGVGLHAFANPRLGIIACAAAVAYVWSASMTMSDYPVWYAPGERSGPVLEWVRLLIGPLGALVSAVIAVPAFEDEWRWAAASLCAAMLALGPRIRQTDELLTALASIADAEFIRGRSDITLQLHSHPVHTLEMLETALETRDDLDRMVYDGVRNASGELREILALDLSAHVTLEWPQVLQARASRLAGQGFKVTFDLPEGPVISQADRKIARIVLDELTQNAKKAQARTMHARLFRDGPRWTMTLADDGEPINPQTFLRPLGGLQRLERLMSPEQGHVTFGTPKFVQATWRATELTGVAAVVPEALDAEMGCSDGG